ncbi:MAG: transglutaminase-like domain-containing protein [Bacteroidales bacterium]|jgi:regulator of sirC expression with transglutaminase-like and TPR domain|nr:transglutaminase-like domain-containing protein [Bacteroidales bacterium]
MSKISALIKLLEDPDEQIFSQVRNEILSMGEMAIPDLENALVSSSNEDYTERITDILNDIQTERLVKNFAHWKNSQEQDLLELMVLIEQIRDFNFVKQHIVERIAQIKMDIWLELNEHQTILEQIKIINRIFYAKHGLTADEKEPANLHHFFVYNVLMSKKGNDTTLGVLYLYLAQSQRISFSGVKLLSNFLLAYTHSSGSKSLDDVLFYLNPYKNAAMFPLSNLLEYFAAAGIKLNVSEVTPCSNVDIANRWLWFIQQVYINKGDEEKLALVNKLLELFAHV